uniref:Uncharacterized protein n=1 Tax=Nymphaea colorata TaxID=210225 RepID=A0A5K0V3V4_9MAGN
MGVIRIHRKRPRIKAFRLNAGRLPVQQMQVKLMDFLRLLRKMKSIWEKAMESLKKEPKEEVRIAPSSRPPQKCLRRWESNAFYAEAIADCLEFIKRTSLQVEPENKVPRLVQ